MDRLRNTRLPDLPLHRLEVPLPHLLPFAIGTFDTIGPLSRASFPHRHTFYEIVHVTGGSGAHVLDLVRRPVEPPQLCVITPGQVHHWDEADRLTGHVVLFNEDFLLPHADDAAALRLLAGRPGHPAGDQAAPIAALLADMGEEYRELRPGYQNVLRACLHILIARASRTLGRTGDAPDAACGEGAAGEATAGAARDRATELASAFGRLLCEPEGAGRSVGWYARELGVSVGHFQTLVRRATGRSPGSLIRQQQTLEAKRLLSGTDMTVRQISYAAGFSDAAYFCRFFRRETGMSPGEFRARTAGRNHHDPRIESIAAHQDGP
ncbi:AraC family transcriptional regulator [Streptomyces sp. NPDC048606]|uniref:AraC family transcriptional regulator n=1 Tax=Streptomyces sp. NPDC048606 TaxID=3154726 RepID=UPI00341D088F